MKNPILLLPICFLLSVTSAFAQPSSKKKTDIENEKLKGKVAQVTQKYYSAEKTKSGKDTLGEQYESSGMSYVMVYNSIGYVTEATYYVFKDSLESRNVFKYDGGGGRVTEEWYTGDNELDYKIENKYSNMGKLVESKKIKDGSCIEKYVYENNPTGFPTKCTVYDGDDKMISTKEYKYDEYGNKIEEDDYNPKGKIMNKYLYQYDSKGNATEAISYNADGTQIMKQKWVYEYRGNVSSQSTFDNNNKLVEKSAYSFNDQALVSEWVNYDREGFPQYNYTYTYEYDSHGNWIKKTELKAGVATFITVRDIKYSE